LKRSNGRVLSPWSLTLPQSLAPAARLSLQCILGSGLGRRARRLAAAAVALAVTLASHVNAQDDASSEKLAIELGWDAPGGCPTAVQVRREALRLLGGQSRLGAKHLRARAVVSRDDKGQWQLAMVTETGGSIGNRKLSGESCKELADAAALILALAYDPEAVAVARQPPPSSPDKPPPAPAPLPIAASAPPRRPGSAAAGEQPTMGGREGDLLFFVGALASADLGAMPSAAFGVGGQVGLSAYRLRIDLAVTYWLPQQHAVAESDAGGEVSFFTGSLSGCPILIAEPVQLGPCAAFELGRMHAAGYGVDNPSEQTILWVGARVGGRLGVIVADPLALGVQLEAVVPFVRPRWVLERVGPVDQPGAVTARGMFGAELLF